MKRVVVGLSGGVDSSVAAWLLKEQGYDVLGIFMRNWHDESVLIGQECPWIDDSNDALMVAEKLGIPFQVVDLSAEYKSRIVDYMFAEYERGRTPNPDVLCNREIKFDVFLQTALKLGADYVATGHYCQKGQTTLNGQPIYRLLAGRDPNKDQSYFLCQLTQDQLAKALFPIGHLRKPEVREMAREQDLVTAEKKDSQGLCFVGKVRLPDFLQQKLAPKQGDIVELSPDLAAFHRNGVQSLEEQCAPYPLSSLPAEWVGRHPGAHFYTVGQRKGLNVGGKPEPLFVVGTDTDTNRVFTGMGDQHPALYRQGLFVAQPDVHWIRTDQQMQPGEERQVLARIRYRQPLESAMLHQREEGMYIIFAQPQRGVASGQFVAWYDGEELLGSGVIG